MSGWTHTGDTEPRARKEYTCGLCGLRIRKGARHIARRGIDSEKGRVTFRGHAVCMDASSKWDQYDWECWSEYFDEFRQFELGMK